MTNNGSGWFAILPALDGSSQQAVRSTILPALRAANDQPWSATHYGWVADSIAINRFYSNIAIFSYILNGSLWFYSWNSWLNGRLVDSLWFYSRGRSMHPELRQQRRDWVQLLRRRHQDWSYEYCFEQQLLLLRLRCCGTVTCKLGLPIYNWNRSWIVWIWWFIQFIPFYSSCCIGTRPSWNHRCRLINGNGKGKRIKQQWTTSRPARSCRFVGWQKRFPTDDQNIKHKAPD